MTNPNVKRRRTKPATPRYHWFQGASVRELHERLSAVNLDTARLEIRTEGDKMTLDVVAEGEATDLTRTPPINDSRICPPICPH